MNPITDEKELFKVETWLIELKCWLKCEAMMQHADVAGIYLERAKEIGGFLDSK